MFSNFLPRTRLIALAIPGKEDINKIKLNKNYIKFSNFYLPRLIAPAIPGKEDVNKIKLNKNYTKFSNFLPRTRLIARAIPIEEDKNEIRLNNETDVADQDKPDTMDTYYDENNVIKVVDPTIPKNYPIAGRRNSTRWTPAEKHFRNTVMRNSYLELDDRQAGQKAYMWLNDYLPKLPKEEQRRFIFQDPNLRAWEEVFKRGTDTKTIRFNLAFLNTNNFLLDPVLWAGKSLKLCLFLYYLLLTKRFVVYVKDESIFYQFDGKRWQITPAYQIAHNLGTWLSTLSLNSVDSVITSNDGEIIERFKDALTINTWPYVMGHNFSNGFLTLKDGKYTLMPHSPTLWAKHITLVTVPEKIIPDIEPNTLRFLLDLTQENLINLNLLKQILSFVVYEGSHQLIINLNGNSGGAKTQLMNYVSDVIGDAFRAGNFRQLNGFQREQLLLNSRVIHFPDSNPKGIAPTGSEADLLKGASGGDLQQVEHKGAQVYQIRNKALLVITNNVDFDAVPFYREPAIADRVLNFVAPSIKTWANISDLRRRLGDNLATAIFMFGLTVDPEITRNAQRASEYNAVTGAGHEKFHTRFIMEECVYFKDEKCLGQELYDAYKVFMQKIDKNFKIENRNQFYQNLAASLARVEPRDVSRIKKQRDGVTFKNIKVARPNPTNDDGHQTFYYTGTSKIRDLLNRNALRRDAIIFQTQDGRYIQGPRLNPQCNQDMFETLIQVKDKHLKGLLDQKFTDYQEKAFELTGFGGDKEVHNLGLDDFAEQNVIEYQSSLAFSLPPSTDITEQAKFEKDALVPYLSGKLSPMVSTPSQQIDASPVIEYIDPSYKYFGAYNHASKYFFNRLADSDIEKLSKKDAIQRVVGKEHFIEKQVDFSIFDPNQDSRRESTRPKLDRPIDIEPNLPTNEVNLPTPSQAEATATKASPDAESTAVDRPLTPQPPSPKQPKKRGRKAKTAKTGASGPGEAQAQGEDLTEVDNFFEQT